MTDFSLVELEDQYMATKPNYGIHRPGLYPSESSVKYLIDGEEVVDGGCMRASWYRLMNIPSTGGPNVSLQMKGNLGKWGEIGIVNRWKEMGIWVDNNVKFFNKELFVSGELDAIIREPGTDKLLGIELKSFYNFAANKEICGGKQPPRPGRPKMSHFLQSCIYAWDYQHVLDEYRIFYFERGDGHRVEFKVGFVEESPDRHLCYWQQIPGQYWSYFLPGKIIQPFSIEDIHARCKELLQYAKTKTIPPRDYPTFWPDEKVEWLYKHDRLNKTSYEAWVKNPSKNKPKSWQCSYCKFQGQCQQDSAE